MEKQIVGLAGEYFVAAELLKRNFQVAVTLGNAKSVDLFVRNEATGKAYAVSVKTLRKKPNCFTLPVPKLEASTIYVFVYLNPLNTTPEYFIVTGQELLSNLAGFYGSSLNRLDQRHTVNHGPLQAHRDKWDKLP